MFRENGKPQTVIFLLIAWFFTGCYYQPPRYTPPPSRTSYNLDDMYTRFNSRDYEGTLSICDSVLEENPYETNALMYRSRSLAMLDRADEGLVEAQKLCEIQPGDTDFLSNLGWVASTAEEYEIAVEAYEKAIEVNRYGTANMYNGLAWANVQLGQLDTVLENVNRAIADEPYNDAYIDTRAVYYLKAGDLKLAMIDIDLSIQINPTDPEHHYHKGLIYLALEDWINAYDEFTLTKRYKPNFKNIDELISQTEEKVVEIFEEENSKELSEGLEPVEQTEKPY